ncbi:MAG: type II toxin-antitoxin system Phd/YefM family antitoxin [Candidatus Taylorbacteria bacterium]|nr:type II toxin-antitoxin system Phd/YefM family antitoxin [Candidatus Taylorbacteria bacterium]
MNLKNIISITEARRRIFEIINEVQNPDQVYVLTENGRSKAVIMSASEYESLIETIEVDKIFPNLEKDVKELRKDIKTGKYRTYPSLEDMVNSRKILLLRETSKEKYEIQSTNKAKGKKGNRRNPGKR